MPVNYKLCCNIAHVTRDLYDFPMEMIVQTSKYQSVLSAKCNIEVLRQHCNTELNTIN